MKNKINLIILAAGNGARYSDKKEKIFQKINNKTILEYSLSSFLNISAIENIILVSKNLEKIKQEIDLKKDTAKKIFLAVGGTTRFLSFIQGFNFLEKFQQKWTMIHDAARALINPADINHLIKHCFLADENAILAKKSTDTLKQISKDSFIKSTLNRDLIYQAQTPQLFLTKDLNLALNTIKTKNIQITDEALAIEKSGKKIKIIESKYPNEKLTYKSDLEFISYYLKGKKNV